MTIKKKENKLDHWIIIKKLNKHCMQMQTFAFVYLIWGWGVYWQLLGVDIIILR